MDSRLCAQFVLEAEEQLRRKFGDIHSGGDHELATQYRFGLIFIGELATHAAILAFLVPAEAAVGNRFRADELEASQQ